jgi:hypothetical protein
MVFDGPFLSLCYGLTFDTRRSTLVSRGLNVPQKSTRPAAPAKNEQGEYANFERALKKVLSVSHSEIKIRLDAAKLARRNGKRASGRVSRAKG